MIHPLAQAAYLHDFSTPSRDIRVRMAANPDEGRTIQGVKHARTGFQWQLGLNGVRNDDRLSWSLLYDGQFRADVQAHRVSGQLNVHF